MMQNKKCNEFLFTNTLRMFALFLAIVLLLGVLAAGYHLTEKLTVVRADAETDISALPAEGVSNIELEFPTLRNMGYEYYIDDTCVGNYYYAWMNGQFVIVLTDREESVLNQVVIRGHLKDGETAYGYILSQCAEMMEMDAEQLQALTCPYIISEVDYPRTLYYGTCGSVILGACVMVGLFFEMLISLVFPWKHPQLRRVRLQTDKKLLVRDINRQLHDALVYGRENCYITKKYMICTTWFRTDILLLQNVDAVSKHKEMKKYVPWGAPHEVFRLIVSDTSGCIKQHRFRKETDIDEAVIFLRRDDKV